MKKRFGRAIAHLSEAWRDSLLGPSLTEAAVGYSYRGEVTSPGLLGAIRDVDSEFLAFLSKRPEALPQVTSQAFERIVEEVFKSAGFHVERTGLRWGESADLLLLE